MDFLNDPSFNSSLDDFLKSREGVKYIVYKDSLGFPTGGVGHLLNDSERNKYKIGQPISPKVVDSWLADDKSRSLTLAVDQLKRLGHADRWDVVVFTSANFQLGNFEKKFYNTFKALQEKHYEEAINNLKVSLWMRQTPTRCQDMIDLIEKWK